MKILFLLAALANVTLFMWEFKHGAFEPAVKTSQQSIREPIVLVGELKHEVVNIDFKSLYPPGLDPRSDNLLTEQFVVADFIDALLLSVEPQNEAIIPAPLE